MKKLLIALVLMFSITAFAQDKAPAGNCLTQDAAQALQQSQLLDGKVAQNVTCCCRTQNGGQCCNNVTFCGSFIPGCMCSGHSVEAEPSDGDVNAGKIKT